MHAEILTNRLVITSETLSPIYLLKKPEIMEANNGRNNNDINVGICNMVRFPHRIQ